MIDVPTERRIAEDLLAIGAVYISPDAPYTWASGMQSPIYCDNRLTMGHPDVRRRIRDAFADRIRLEDVQPDIIAGTATAGIPHAAWLADALDLPLVYVRSTAKGHGKSSQIEGRYDAGMRAVVIEDLVSTGGSSVTAVAALRAEGVHVDAVLAIFSYGLPDAETAFSQARVPLFTLTDFSHVMDVLRESGNLSAGDAKAIDAWHIDPWRWTEQRHQSEARI